MRGSWKRRDIDIVDRNVHGAWVIWGGIGIRHYYGYTKQEAIRRYRAEWAAKIIICEPSGKKK